MANELIKHVSDASFNDDVLKSSQPVLVDYWAEWCGPCKMIAPILDEVATGYEGKLQVAKMNVDENRDIPAKFGIRGIRLRCAPAAPEPVAATIFPVIIPPDHRFAIRIGSSSRFGTNGWGHPLALTCPPRFPFASSLSIPLG